MAGDHQGALDRVDAVLRKYPGEPRLPQFRAGLERDSKAVDRPLVATLRHRAAAQAVVAAPTLDRESQLETIVQTEARNEDVRVPLLTTPVAWSEDLVEDGAPLDRAHTSIPGRNQ